MSIHKWRPLAIVPLIAAAAACAHAPRERVDIAVPIPNPAADHDQPSTFICADQAFFLTFIDHYNIRELLGDRRIQYGIMGGSWGLHCTDRYRIPAGSHEFVFWYSGPGLASTQGNHFPAEFKPGHDYALCAPALTSISSFRTDGKVETFVVQTLFVDLTGNETCPTATRLTNR